MKTIFIEKNNPVFVQNKNNLSKKIVSIYNEYITYLQSHTDVLQNDVELKIITIYSNVLFGYLREIEILIKTDWYTSIENMTRDILECYAIIKKMFSVHGTMQFNEFYKYLILNDMDQDKKIHNDLKADPTIYDESQRSIDIATFEKRFTNLITEHFPVRISEIDESNLMDSLKRIINSLLKEEPYKQFSSISKNDFIAKALQNNKAITNENYGKIYPGCSVIYRELCHSTHNSISSIESRTINSGFIMLNNPTKNTLQAVSLSYFCVLDVFNEIKSAINTSTINN